MCWRLRGDAIRSEGRFKPEPDGHAYAIDLVEQVVDLNKGIYLDPDLAQYRLKHGLSASVWQGTRKNTSRPPIPASDLRWLEEKGGRGALHLRRDADVL